MGQEFILVFIISLFVFRTLIIIFHEFGHAFAALYHSDEKVSVYIGSYGNQKKSLCFQKGRLECFIKYNVFRWNGGLCIPHGKKITWKGRFLISLFGPLTTLILGLLTGISLFFIQNNLLFFIVLAFSFSCISDFFYNIFPRTRQIQLHDGTFTNNDGKQLVHLWNIRKVYEAYTKASEHYANKEFLDAGNLFEKCIEITPKNRDLYRIAIVSYLSGKDYQKANALQDIYAEIYKNSLDVQDMVSIGVMEIQKENFTRALELFEEAHELLPKNHIILNNYGYVLGLLDRHEEAITSLNESIVIDEKFGYTWNNRGYSKMMLGQLEEGYADLQKALELDDQNSYAYCNLGIYYFKKNNYTKAQEYYQKAYELDPETLHIQKYIDEVKPFLK